ncbi:MAG: DUF115 domain-containing protein [Spirochaetales bacterium]|nr:DUF115 domain-containing protein [Spirochaetales bacterium]
MNKDEPASAGPFPGAELVAVSGGMSVKYLNRYLYSSLNPEAGAERRAVNLPLASGFIYILTSPLLFYGVNTLISRCPPKSTFIYLELNPELARFTRHYYKQRTDKQDSFKMVENTKELLRHLDSIDLSKYRHVELLSLSGGYALSPKEYTRAKDYANALVRTFWSNRATLVQMGRLWVDNLFTNLSSIPSSVPLKSFFTQKPLLVTGAGESLEQTIDEISCIRADIFILAVDTAIPVLSDAGIIPDAVIALEGQHANIYDFYGNLSIPLICDLTASPSLLHQYQGAVSFILSRFDRINLFEHLNKEGISLPEIPPLGSVGVAALHVGMNLTEGPVFFSGLDFSFRPGKTHSRSAPSIKAILNRIEKTKSVINFSHGFEPPVHRVKGKEGNELLTTPNLSVYAALLGNFNQSGRLFDIGKTGIHLDVHRGDIETLKEAVRKAPYPLPDSFFNTDDKYTNSKDPEVTENPNYPVNHQKMSFYVNSSSTADSETLQNFMISESEKLEEFIRDGYLWLAGERTDKLEDKIKTKISRLDYLAISFPDRKGFNDNNPELNESYLKRLLTHAARLKARITNNS